MQALAQGGECVDEEDAVLASRDTDEDMVAVLNHVEFHDGAHELAEVELRHILDHV